MTLENVGIIVSIIFSFISFLAVVYTTGVKITNLEVKVDTMWEFLMKRAMSEALSRGVGTMNSPLVFTEEAMSWFDHMKPELMAIYQQRKDKWNDRDLCIEIEKKLGERILTEICFPHKLYQGCCLLIASEVAKRE